MPDSYYNEKANNIPGTGEGSLPDYGTGPSINPGEQPTTSQGTGVKSIVAATGVPSIVRVASAGRPVDVGAQVGIMRNLEFSAGGRAHRVSTGPYSQSKILPAKG
ncbi:MAG TPA: hypothetical protein VGE45_17650 [Chloroflexia bacterium]